MDTPDPAYRTFVSYIDKSREYYLAQGFDNPYRWAYNTDAPFTPLRKPLADSRLALVTTASLLNAGPDPADLPPGGVYAAATDPPPARLYTQHRFWDKDATHTDDLDSYFPIHHLFDLRDAGRIGSVSPRFYGAPTEYSQRRTTDADAPDILRFCHEDGVDAAILVAL